VRRDIAEGLTWVIHHRVLRPLATGTILLAAATGILLAVLVLHALETLRLPEAGYGVLITIYAVGSLGGAAISPQLRRRVDSKRSLMLAAALGAASIGTLALGTHIALAAVALAALGVATMVWNVTAMTLRQEATPDRLLGRTSSAFNILALGAGPIAAPIGGLIATVTNTTWALLAAAGLCACAVVLLAHSLPRDVTSTIDVAAATEASTDDSHQ